jgi:hypothetical protein
MTTAHAGFDATVRLAIQAAFINGRPTPSVASVAADLDASTPDVADAFDRLAAAHVIVLAPGTHDLVMSAPFASQCTDFAVTVGARTHYANCVWDALGVPAMFAGAGYRADADVRTSCADCGLALAVSVRAGAVSGDPPDAVVHFAVPAARWWADIGYT